MSKNTISMPSGTDWQRLKDLPDEDISSDDTPYDPNDPDAVDTFWNGAIVSRSLPALREQLAQRRRGPQKSPLKVPTTLRLDADLLAALKATGKGWQTRVNDVLRAWVATGRHHGEDGQ